jgi:hypothetical protein
MTFDDHLDQMTEHEWRGVIRSISSLLPHADDHDVDQPDPRQALANVARDMAWEAMWSMRHEDWRYPEPQRSQYAAAAEARNIRRANAAVAMARDEVAGRDSILILPVFKFAA